MTDSHGLKCSLRRRRRACHGTRQFSVYIFFEKKIKNTDGGASFVGAVRRAVLIKTFVVAASIVVASRLGTGLVSR